MSNIGDKNDWNNWARKPIAAEISDAGQAALERSRTAEQANTEAATTARPDSQGLNQAQQDSAGRIPKQGTTQEAGDRPQVPLVDQAAQQEAQSFKEGAAHKELGRILAGGQDAAAGALPKKGLTSILVREKPSTPESALQKRPDGSGDNAQLSRDSKDLPRQPATQNPTSAGAKDIAGTAKREVAEGEAKTRLPDRGSDNEAHAGSDKAATKQASSAQALQPQLSSAAALAQTGKTQTEQTVTKDRPESAPSSKRSDKKRGAGGKEGGSKPSSLSGAPAGLALGKLCAGSGGFSGGDNLDGQGQGDKLEVKGEAQAEGVARQHHVFAAGKSATAKTTKAITSFNHDDRCGERKEMAIKFKQLIADGREVAAKLDHAIRSIPLSKRIDDSISGDISAAEVKLGFYKGVNYG